MLVFALFVIAVCVVVLIKAHDAREDTEPTYVFLEEDTDWQFPPKWREVSRTEER